MNDKQLYACLSKQDRFDTIRIMAQMLYKRAPAPAWRVPFDRRRAQIAHFVNDRRRLPRHSHAFGALLIASVLDLGLWVFALPILPNLAAPIATAHLFALSALFLVAKRQPARQIAVAE